MTEQKHLKALIRARMAKTGERYTAARAHVVKMPRPSLRPVADFRAHDRHCMTAVFTADDRQLITGGFGGQARVWTIDGTLAGELVGHEASVNVVALSADGNTAVTASSDRTVRVWDVSERAERMVLGPHGKQVTALALAPDGSAIWSGAHDGKLRAWSIEDGSALSAVPIGSRITGIAGHPTDGRMAVATTDAGLRVFDPDGSEVTAPTDGSEMALSVAWSGDGSFVVAGTPDGATVWATDPWEAVRSIATGGSGVMPLALAPDGSSIALGWEHHLGLWTADGDDPAELVGDLPKGVYGISYSHDGSRIALAAADGRVRIWQLE